MIEDSGWAELLRSFGQQTSAGIEYGVPGIRFNKGQTIGKLAVKTRIVDLNGNIPNFGKLLVFRYLILGLVSQIPIVGGLAGLVDALFIFGKERRCLHDYMAGTRVINA